MTPLRIALITAELTPFAKVGGLADVSAALARYLHGEGHDIRAFLPKYGDLQGLGLSLEPHPDLQPFLVGLGDRSFRCAVATTPLPDSGASIYFIDCPELFDAPGVYLGEAADALRFAVLSNAVLDVCRLLGWVPQVLHCNDWQTALLPLFLEARGGPQLRRAKTLLTLHNLGYQGVFGSEMIALLGLESVEKLFPREDLRDRRFNFLKTGILNADFLTTVSPTYAAEIQGTEQGMGLESYLRVRADNLVGIVNGVDTSEWDPATDKWIPSRYSVDDLKGKVETRRALLERFDLMPAPQAPVLSIVSRLVWQKGFDLLFKTAPDLIEEWDLRLLVLGTGESRYERFFNDLVEAHPRRVAFHKGFSHELAHWFEAGGDIFLMPSRYEPCGLNQMYSLLYGNVPLVRRTGGLADTVAAYDPVTDTGTGFVFEEFTPEALRHALEQALVLYQDSEKWQRLMLRGMSQDFSWQAQGQRYVQLYQRLAAQHPLDEARA